MSKRTKKLTAWFFLVIFSVETLYPGAAYALTSGPSQPEMERFEPAGAGDLVELFTGDLKYNIPLADVGGYPLNLSYKSGSGMEEEASWVGAGWTLNPGAITRDMRGLPDDFKGDLVTKEYDRKEFKKVGGQIVLKPSALAWEFGSASIKVGVYKDNYYGMGAELGASLGFKLAKNKKTSLTAGLDIGSDSRDGVSITPSLSLSRAHDFWSDESVRSLSGSLTYNTRSGLKQVQLDASFSSTKKRAHMFTMDFSGVKYFGQTYTPSISNNTSNNGFTFSFDLGPSIFGGYIGIGGSGYVYNEKILNPLSLSRAYGYMNYLSGRQNKAALLDFNREKDGVFIPGAPSIGIPVATQDFFMATSQSGSKQFRPFFGGNYIVFDQAHYNSTLNLKGALTIGVGNTHKSGGRIDFTTGDAYTNKWTSNNEYLQVGEAAFDQVNNPAEEPVYFKAIGEQTESEETYLTKIGNELTQQVAINDAGNYFTKAKAFKALKSREFGRQAVNTALKKDQREKRTAAISYLTAAQAKKYALDKTINGEPREGGYRKSHHISEMTMTDHDGQRMVYGIPVYNTTQQDVSFSAQPPADVAQTARSGLIPYTTGTDGRIRYKNGRDQMFSKETVPAYATSFLLTGVLSPDYVDLQGDGITDDDIGSAVKLNYAKHSGNYQWRAPYAADMANYNEGFYSDKKDDKGSYTYGVKEVWYLESIDSKTMVAFFETSDREDGTGVAGEHGGPGGTKLKKLDRIKLYSKADWVKNGTNAVPVKTVHFEYDYSLCAELPNNTGATVMAPDPLNPAGPQINVNTAKGKLTLKKVYFTFGKNNRGKSNPYNFEYDVRLISSIPGLPVSNDVNEASDRYTQRQQDRWGTYKHSFYNRLQGGAMKMNNSEFPYALQENVNTAHDEKLLAGRFASKWQLTKIITPTGSTIEAEYESDDYAYVQNRRAMQMCFVKGIGNSIGTSNSGLINANGFTVELPVPVTDGDKVAGFKRMYLQGADGKLMDKLWYKVFSNITNRGHYEFVQGYAELDLQGCTVSGDGLSAFIPLKKLGGKNPVAKAAWQMLKVDLPHYAYDNYDNSDAVDGDVVAAIKSLVSAFLNLREIVMPFETIASNKSFSNSIDLSKSIIRLYNPTGKKLGGGCRVKKITMRDNWADMATGGKNASYGQLYSYLTKDASGREISSGVAAYEPSIGNEENPFHEPINFTEKVHWSVDRYHFIEKPFCESYFPAADVGYSKVIVTSFGDDYVLSGNLVKHAGYVEHEFYTARDFPTVVDNLPLEQNNYENSLILKLFSSTYVKRVVASQGFKIVLNDMHGKSRSVKAFNKGGDLLSVSEYFYNVEDENAAEKVLNNQVDVLRPNGTIRANTVLGTDVDFITDMRESVNESVGTSVGGYAGGMVIPFFIPIFAPYGAVNFGYSITADSYHSSSAVKVIHKYGILKKVVTTQNGSTTIAENLLWDGETGQVLLSRSQNEFNDYLYSFTYPAWMGYDGMAGAYKNIGNIYTNFTTGADGIVPAIYNSHVFPGDELVAVDGNQKGWIVRSVNNTLRFIDETGDFIVGSGRYATIRSGRRNLPSAVIGNIVCLVDPRVVVNGSRTLQFDTNKKILDAQTAFFREKWQVPVFPQWADYDCQQSVNGRFAASSTLPAFKDTMIQQTGPNGVQWILTTVPDNSPLRSSLVDESCICSCLKPLFDYLINTNQLFIQLSQHITVGQLVTSAKNAGYNVGDCAVLKNNRTRYFYALTSNATGTIYTAQVGACKVSIRSNSANPVSFYGLTSQICADGSSVSYSGAGTQSVSQTYTSTCTVTQGASGVSNPNQKIVSVTQNGVSGGLSQFQIPGISQIPSNATITTANLYLYALQEGYSPPAFPYSHSANPGNYLQLDRVTNPRQCNSNMYSGLSIGTVSLTGHYEDVVFNIGGFVQDVVSGTYQNNGFWLLYSDPTNSLLNYYAAFASENYPTAAKRPRLEVTYTVPGTAPNVATLTVDECNSCPDPLNEVINPYYTGLLGNWRSERVFSYIVDREQKAGLSGQQGGTNIRSSGYYSSFDPFWVFQPGGYVSTSVQYNSADPAQRWVWKNQAIYFDQRGNEIESVDALKQFSAALFGYKESVAIAIASNARRNEIAYDGFEDYYFSLQNGPENCPPKRHFNWGLVNENNNWCGQGGCISTERAHTGKYSYKLNNGTTNVAHISGYSDTTLFFMDYDYVGRIRLSDNRLANGFGPILGKQYVISMWVYDGVPNSNKITGLNLVLNGETNVFMNAVNRQQSTLSNMEVPVVEGWKRLELLFSGGSFNLQFNKPGGGNVYIDDVRVHPFDARFNSYVYDDQTMRLMAQLDETNAATFYEYDDEGTPIRVKKETEQGIKTIKENRSYYRKRP
jgi:hypothetical protein